METEKRAKDDARGENAYAAPTSAPVLQTKKKGFRLFELLVLLAIIGILFAMLIPATRRVRPAARRVQCLNNMRQIALAMINYESANGHFPPAYIADENGKPMHSWRVLILPHLEQQELYDRYSMDEPWDGPNNSKLHDEIVPLFRCPSSTSAESCSDYELVTGPGTGFDGDKSISMKDITDGSSNTIMLVEVFDPDHHWMEPKDISTEQLLSPILEEVEVSPNHSQVRNVALFDGSTHSIDTKVPLEALRKLVMIADDEVVNVLDW